MGSLGLIPSPFSNFSDFLWFWELLCDLKTQMMQKCDLGCEIYWGRWWLNKLYTKGVLFFNTITGKKWVSPQLIRTTEIDRVFGHWVLGFHIDVCYYESLMIPFVFAVALIDHLTLLV
ncbi:hypothetical protein Droror1_Dr00010002 [Drosera rotundifolia]